MAKPFWFRVRLTVYGRFPGVREDGYCGEDRLAFAFSVYAESEAEIEKQAKHMMPAFLMMARNLGEVKKGGIPIIERINYEDCI
jgi:hypothetical protein